MSETPKTDAEILRLGKTVLDEDGHFPRTEVGVEFTRKLEKSTARNGNWLDDFGCCKVCDGEIPHGHTNSCDIFKLERDLSAALRERDEFVSELARLFNTDKRKLKTFADISCVVGAIYGELDEAQKSLALINRYIPEALKRAEDGMPILDQLTSATVIIRDLVKALEINEKAWKFWDGGSCSSKHFFNLSEAKEANAQALAHAKAFTEKNVSTGVVEK